MWIHLQKLENMTTRKQCEDKKEIGDWHNNFQVSYLKRHKRGKPAASVRNYRETTQQASIHKDANNYHTVFN